jgi:hypothetical protein
LEEHGYSGLADRRKGKPRFRRVPLKRCEEVLQLYEEKYFDLGIAAFSREVAGGTQYRAELVHLSVKVGISEFVARVVQLIKART